MALSNKYHNLRGHQYHNLPNRDLTFVNRKKAISKIADYLLKYRIVNLKGQPGIGKTSLAIQFAYILMETFNTEIHSIVFISAKDKELRFYNRDGGKLYLKDVSKKRKSTYTKSIKGLKELILSVSGHRTNDSKSNSLRNRIKKKLRAIETQESQVYSWLKNRKTFIIIDDVEGWGKDLGELIRFINGLPENTLVLFTSRYSLYGKIPGLAELSIGPLNSKEISSIINNAVNKFRNVRLTSKDFEKIISYSNGNALIASLSASMMAKFRLTKIDNIYDKYNSRWNENSPTEFILMHLYSSLNNDAKVILKVISLAKIDKIKLNVNDLKGISGLDNLSIKKALRELDKSSLINTNKRDNYEMDIHELVAESVIKKEKNRLHNFLNRYNEWKKNKY